MTATVLRERYRLVELIDQGGSGDVWLAVDKHLSRTVAAKLLPAPPPEDPDLVARLRLDWLRFLSRVDHPDIVGVYDLDTDPVAGLFVIMQYVRSESLRAVLARAGRFSPTSTMRLVAQLADTLQALHAVGIAHREVGPDRILVRPDGTAALAVVGSMRSYVVTRAATVPPVSAMVHTSPEQLMGAVPGPRSDIYSVGATAYHCLTGRPPFDGDHPLEVAYRIATQDAPPLPTDIPAPIRSIVERALARTPEDRWPTAAALASAARMARGIPVR